MIDKTPEIGVIRNGSLCIGARMFLVDIRVRGDTIESIKQVGLISEKGNWEYDAQGRTILPGWIDPHVHLQLDVGAYLSADTFVSGSRAAAFGGMTALMDFTDVVTEGEDQLYAYLQERRKAAQESVMPVYLHLTVAQPKIAPARLVDIAVEEGIKSIKVFTTYQDSGRMTKTGYLYGLLEAAFDRHRLVLIHAEEDDIISSRQKAYGDGPIPYTKLPEIRPSVSESIEVMKIAHMVEKTKASVYFVHISSGYTVEALSKHYGHLLGRRIFVETCPQYLTLDQRVYDDERGYLYTLCPPLRSFDEQQKLVQSVIDRHIHSVGTDHCPFQSQEKWQNRSDLAKMPYGLPGVELSFSLVYTRLLPYLGSETLDLCTKLFSSQPAKIFGLYPFRGKIVPGAKANLTIFDMDKKWVVDSKNLASSIDYSPYEGMELQGKVVSTLVNGRFLVKDEKWVEPI